MAGTTSPAGSTVAEAVGRALAAEGVDTVFGVLGSGNFAVANALVAAGARYVATRHEAGAVTAADAWARATGRVGVATVHQGPGLTNAVTGLAEAAKSRTPLVVLAADTAAAATGSNFRIDAAGLAASVGAESTRLASPASAVADAVRAVRRARLDRRTVVLALPLDVQAAPAPAAPPPPPAPAPPAVVPDAGAVAGLAGLLAGAQRPVLLAGRGAVLAGGRDAIEALAERAGALLATSAVAHGLFAGSSWSLGISGGFASPVAADLLASADAVVALGASLTMWTTRHGRLVSPSARVAQVDVDPDRIGAAHRVDLGVVGDVALTARAVLDALGPGVATGWRTPATAARLAAAPWRCEPFADAGGPGDDGLPRVDPRSLSVALDDLLPEARVVVTDSGAFMGWPTMYLRVPDERGSVFTQSFQSVGLGLATALGAALANPDRLTVAAVGDGGFLMALAELETLVRLALPVLVVVYDDAAYGAEVHHFGPTGAPLDLVRFPDTDLAALARGAGAAGETVREPGDLAAVRAWLDGPRDRPLVVDAKIVGDVVPEWLEEAFRGH